MFLIIIVHMLAVKALVTDNEIQQ